MTYPGSAPWGPHGPQVPPNSVTPNPTAPSAPHLPGQTPPSSDPYAGGGAALDGDWRPTGTARPKSVGLGLILTFCFGPLGLFYAVWGTRQALPCILWGGATFLILAWYPNIGLTPFWAISMIWSTLAIKAYNRQFEGHVQGT